MKRLTLARVAGGVFCVLIFSALARAAEEAPVAKTPPTMLPKMNVSGGVPLTKVAEHKMLEARFAPAVAAQGDYIYIAAGLKADQSALRSVERFNVRTGKAEKFAELRVPRFWHGGVAAEGKFYVFGGLTTQAISNDGVVGADFETSMEIVDLTTGKVSRGPDMPKPWRSFGCVPVGRKIFVIGGQRIHHGRRGETSATAVFDLEKQTWSEGPPMATPRDVSAAVVDGGFVIAAGGYDRARGPLREVEVFDPREAAWHALPPLTRGTSAHSIVFLGHHLFLFGDYQKPEELLAYDLKTKTSEVFTLGYRPARHTAAIAHEGKIYVIGGRETKEAPPLDLIQVFEPTKPAARK